MIKTTFNSKWSNEDQLPVSVGKHFELQNRRKKHQKYKCLWKLKVMPNNSSRMHSNITHLCHWFILVKYNICFNKVCQVLAFLVHTTLTLFKTASWNFLINFLGTVTDLCVAMDIKHLCASTFASQRNYWQLTFNLTRAWLLLWPGLNFKLANECQQTSEKVP